MVAAVRGIHPLSEADAVATIAGVFTDGGEMVGVALVAEDPTGFADSVSPVARVLGGTSQIVGGAGGHTALVLARLVLLHAVVVVGRLVVDPVGLVGSRLPARRIGLAGDVEIEDVRDGAVLVTTGGVDEQAVTAVRDHGDGDIAHDVALGERDAHRDGIEESGPPLLGRRRGQVKEDRPLGIGQTDRHANLVGVKTVVAVLALLADEGGITPFALRPEKLFPGAVFVVVQDARRKATRQDNQALLEGAVSVKSYHLSVTFY